ncbi:MAG TPA: HD-GYP domain-containing protein [Patescibacteria group bacterium]|nr:HD-GYP domain-containing protein [Patescibacteria group bacterium]
MKRVDASELVPGMVVAAELMSADGMLKLLESGVRLTPSQIAKIREWGVARIAIVGEGYGNKARQSGVRRTESEFAAIYENTVNDIIDAFRDFDKTKNLPLLQVQELAEQRIPLLVETMGAIEFLDKIRTHSEQTFRHSLDVAVIAGILGKWLERRGPELQNIILAGLLHDIGKLAVPVAILEKPGPLSPAEFAVIKRHSREGYHLVRQFGAVDDGVLRGILQHHERLDGSGYPDGLTGDDICFEAEVIAIADIYHAMTSDRAYRRKMTPFAAMEAIAGEMFKKLSPAVSITFIANMKDRLLGCGVRLTDGQTAKVIGFSNRDKYFTEPVVCTEKGDLVDLKSGEISIAGIQ